MYNLGGTIKDALTAIQKNKYVLPAIQREFVWKPEQIEMLFDSIMQGYPFGTFLFWNVEAENSNKYNFYSFVCNYHERNNPHCAELPIPEPRELTAVLDGQQRLTALNIGLCGSLALKIPYKRRNNPDAYPPQHLHLNLLYGSDQDEMDQGAKYKFKFLTEEQATQKDEKTCWFPVAEILKMEKPPQMLKWLNKKLDQEQLDDAFEVLDRLFQSVHNHNLISFYKEKSQELDKVLNIFIRMNSGGTVLSYSDLLLSIAVAQWDGDARKEIHTLVDDLNQVGEGFSFSKDFVLKAGLMLADIGSVGFKVDNFNLANMTKLEDKWSEVKTALKLTVQLVAKFGFREKTIRADSALLPIAYYICHRGLGNSYLTASAHEEDRQLIKNWLIRGFLKQSGIWGSGLDTFLTALRDKIKEHGENGFPLAEIEDEMKRRGKSLAFSEDEIDEISEMQYGDRRIYSLLTFLFPFVDTANNQFHIDHVFPKSRFTAAKLLKAGVEGDDVGAFRELFNCLPNLQLLEGVENIEKRAKMPLEWMEETYPTEESQTNYCSNHQLGDIPECITEFSDFYDARRELLKAKLVEMLGTTAGVPAS